VKKLPEEKQEDESADVQERAQIGALNVDEGDDIRAGLRDDKVIDIEEFADALQWRFLGPGCAAGERRGSASHDVWRVTRQVRADSAV